MGKLISDKDTQTAWLESSVAGDCGNNLKGFLTGFGQRPNVAAGCNRQFFTSTGFNSATKHVLWDLELRGHQLAT
jgi:hypothetical protein